MVFLNIDLKVLDKRRSEKKKIKIKGCILQHFFVYESNSTKIDMNEYLCDCKSCSNFEFSSSKKPVTSAGEISDNFLKDCLVDEEDDQESNIYESVSIPSFVNLLLHNACDPAYFALLEKKYQTTEKLQDRYGHVVLPGDLQKSRSCHPSKKKFNYLDHTDYIVPS